jgi:hypothetical protein
VSTLNENERILKAVELTKMQSAAKKAWETIKANREKKKLEEQSKTGAEVQAAVKEEIKKEEKVTHKKVKEIAIGKFEKLEITEKDKKELKELNGDELKSLAKENGKRVERNEILKRFKKVQGEGLGNIEKAIQVGATIASKLELVEKSS